MYFLLRVLVHCVVANYHRKQEMEAPMLELFYEVGSMLGNQARNDILDENFAFVPPGTVSDQRPIKVYFLQAVLMVLLPLETAPDGAPNKVLFDSPKLSLREWNQLEVDDPHKFWKHLIPGKWTGFYADYRIGLDRAEFNELIPICDGPMRDLILDWTTETKEAFFSDSVGKIHHEFPSTLYFTGAGKDDVNEFRVTGRIDIATRNVLVSKKYPTFGWQYKGTLNEFGIAGVWGEGNGMFLLWKVGSE
ncbi:hypothetical protein HDU79_004967 [Rhizoclosmatium sp. JEL0117]|nr:hypothetical protein HDU79_004967 [Rhizoclosmatium sp. JEL0117]